MTVQDAEVVALPVAVARTDSSTPSDIAEFVVRHGLTAHLETALRLVGETFPPGSPTTLELEGDPDTEGQWIVIDVRYSGNPGVVLNHYNQFVACWIAVTPPWVGNFLRLTFKVT